MSYLNYIITFCWKYWGFKDQNKTILWECLDTVLSCLLWLWYKDQNQTEQQVAALSVHPLTKLTSTVPWALAGKQLNPFPISSARIQPAACCTQDSACQAGPQDKPSAAISSQKPTVPKWLMLSHKMCAVFLLKTCYFYGFSTLKRNCDLSFHTKQYNYNQLFFDNCSTYSVIIYLSEDWFNCNFHFSRVTCVS